MSEPSDQRVAELEQGLEAVSQTLARLQWLTRDEADRIGARFDRLASQVAAISPTVPSGTPGGLPGAE